MTYRLVHLDSRSYLEYLPGAPALDGEPAALDLVAACGEVGADRVLLHPEHLPAAFTDLRSGLAGQLLLKFSNYRLRVAALLSPERVGQGRFYEFALETNRGRQFGVFTTREEAEAWLLKE